MRRGGKFVGTVAMLSVAACGGEQGKLEIRSMATPLAAGQRPVPFRIAEARGQFALGNVALALEAFRMALREDPRSVDAMSGIAACYDRMARFDLSRRHYEAALAIAPADPTLLTAFAASLDLQGRSAEAASVRNEVAQRLALATAAPAPQMVAVAAVTVRRADAVAVARRAPEQAPARAVTPTKLAERTAAPAVTTPAPARPIRIATAPPAASPPPRTAAAAIGRSVTVALPPAQSATIKPPAQSARIEPPAQPARIEPPARPAARTAVRAAPPPAPPAVETVSAEPAIQAAARVALPPVIEAPLAKPAAANAVTLALRPAVPPTAASAAPVAAPQVTITLPPARTAAAPAKAAVEEPAKLARTEPVVAKEAEGAKSGPRIERTSLLEVALITAPEPKWRALTVRRTQRSATVRFVPERHASLSLTGIRILNAARVNRLAARTRSYLVGRGWTPMRIGDAPTVRARSVILYPPERRRTAQRLSAQFGFVIAQRPGVRQITVLLGRDAVHLPALRESA